MGGPVASVVLARHPDSTDLLSRLRLLNTDNLPAARSDGWFETRIHTTIPIGGSYTGEGRLFDVGWEPDDHLGAYEEDEPGWVQTIVTRFGFAPSSSIGIAAGINRPADHRILGELALYLARVYGGVINFNGALIPASTHSEEEKASLTRPFDASWSQIAAPREQFFAKLPGRIVALPYRVTDDRMWVTHVADCEFMAAWLSHPDFHMIK